MMAQGEAVKIKICGLTRLEDARLALELGAWALGFIFYRKSPRFISPENAGKILSTLSSQLKAVRKVGVFVNPSLAEIRTAVEQAPLSVIQLHGDESEAFIQEVKAAFPKLEIFQAFRLDSFTKVSDNIDFQLVDSMSQNAYGGTGTVVDWSRAAKITGAPLILAGGLNAENVAQAMMQVSPFAVDVSSGVELSPGVKSEEKLRAFFSAVKNARGGKE
jgi:phosphoribosylanthranilate isomerase